MVLGLTQNQPQHDLLILEVVTKIRNGKMAEHSVPFHLLKYGTACVVKAAQDGDDKKFYC